MMKFGMPALIELDSLDLNLELCRKLGLSFVEINMNLPQFRIARLKDLRPPSDIELTLHLPEELNVWDFNENIREAYLNLVIDAVNLAKKRNIRILNMHMNPGIYFTLPDQRVYLFRKYRERYLENTKLFAGRVAKAIRGSGISVCIENTGIYDNDFILNALSVLMAHECFHLTWDTGHDHSSGNKDSSYIRTRFDKLRHMHLHDALPGKDHLQLGRGELQIAAILEETKNQVERTVLETKTVEGLVNSVKYLKDRELFK